MNVTTISNTSRKIHMEFLRIFACFFVLFNHSCSAMSKIYLEDFSKSRVVFLILYFICRTAVPVFLMITGANLLSKKDSSKKWLKRLAKSAVLICLTSILYHIYESNTFSFTTIIQNIFSAKISTTSWYLYLYLGIILILPVLQSLQLQQWHILLIILLYMFGPGLFPLLNYHFGIQSTPFLFEVLFPWPIILLLMGHYMENMLDEKSYNKKGAIVAVFLLSFSLAFQLFCAIYQMKCSGYIKISDFYSGLNFPTPTLLCAASIYYLCKFIKMKSPSGIFQRAILALGKYTLFIFIVGDILRDKMVFIYDILKQNISEIIAILIYDISVMGVGILLALIYYEIVLKGIRYIIRLIKTTCSSLFN